MMFRETFRVRLWAMLHIPLLSFVRPSVLQLDDAVMSRCPVPDPRYEGWR